MVEHWNPQPIGNIAQRTRVNSQVRYVDHAKSWRPLKGFASTQPTEEQKNGCRSAPVESMSAWLEPVGEILRSETLFALPCLVKFHEFLGIGYVTLVYQGGFSVSTTM
jgi:hypothetical protein